jgi:hypothetical protein
MKIRITMLMVILVTAFYGVTGQRLMGLVVEKNKEGVDEQLPGANVIWLGTTIGVTTGSNGVFMIDRVDGATQLVISYVGYRSDTVTITDQTSVKVTLQSNEYLQEVTVQGWKPTT